MTLMTAEHMDQTLLARLSANDMQAFEHIYNRYWKILYQYAFNVLRHDEWAQDCVQEVFLALWERRQTAAIISLPAWLRGAIRFQALSVVRKQRMDQDFYKRLSGELQHVLTSDPVLFKELQHLYIDIINKMPADQQEIFTLSRSQGLNYAQIARRLNISVKTVEKKISRSLRHIKLHSHVSSIVAAMISVLPA